MHDNWEAKTGDEKLYQSLQGSYPGKDFRHQRSRKKWVIAHLTPKDRDLRIIHISNFNGQ